MNCQANVSRRRAAGASSSTITDTEGWIMASAAP